MRLKRIKIKGLRLKLLNEVDTTLAIKVKNYSGGYSLCQSWYMKKMLSKFKHLRLKEATKSL